MEKKKTRVGRQWAQTFGYGIAGLAMFVPACRLMLPMMNAPQHSFGGTGNLVLGVLGVLVAIIAVFLLGGAYLSSSASCPGCGAKIEYLEGDENQGAFCEKCERYSEGKHGELWLTDDDALAEKPIFGAALPAMVQWPEGCCVCGKAATRTLPSTVTLVNTDENAKLAGVPRGVTAPVFTLEIPHCAKHEGGAKLATSSPEPIKISFRSYPYQRAFRSLNNVKARAA